ncbi:MAG: PAS domain-containing protein [Deltaproteobacteria bacterium]
MKPIKIFLQILLVITAAEVMTMVMLSHLGLHGSAYIVADTGLLLLLSAPFIHLWVVNGATRSYSLEAFLARTALEHEESMREKAESSERRFRHMLGRLDAVVYEADAATGKFLFVSDCVESMLGYSVDRWLADPDLWASIVHPDDRDRAVERRKTAAAHKREFRMKYRAITAGGNVVELLDSVRVTLDEKGNPRKLHGVMLDRSGISESANQPDL